MKKKNKQALPLLACGAAYGLWGLNTPLIKTSLESVPLFALLFLKFGLGAVVFTLLARKNWKPLNLNIKKRVILATLLGYAVSATLMYKGIQLSGGLNASLIYLLAPLLIYFSSIRFLKEKYNSKLLIGVITGFLGALLIVGAPLLATKSGASGSPLGNIFVLIAVISDVYNIVLIKPVLKKVPVLQMTAMRFSVAAIALLPFAIVQAPHLNKIDFNTATIVAVGYNLIFGTLVAFYLYHWGFNRLSGEQLSPLHYIDPMVGSAGSIIILGDRPTATTIIGILLIGCGLYFSEVHKLKLGHHIGHHR